MKKLIPLLLILSLGIGLSNASAQTVECPFDPAWLTSNKELPKKVQTGYGTECNFHRLVMQYFAYETRGSSPEFLEWMPVQGVFGPDSQLLPTVVAWNHPEEAFQKISTDIPKLEKNQIASNLTKQAGSGHPLLDQSTDLINYTFYDVRMNETMYNFITKDCKLYYNSTTGYSSCTNPNFKGDKTRYPEGSVEIKVAWKVIPDNANTINPFITTTGWVSHTGKDYKPVTLGMVGYHLVIATKAHPEFIWGTFEHRFNSPNCHTDLSASSKVSWSYYNLNCETNCEPNHFYTNPKTKEPKKTQVCLVEPQGKGDPENIDAVKKINNSFFIQAGLKQPTLAAYRFGGSLWTKGGVPPIILAGKLSPQTGSTLLANSVAETYKQSENCFACHNYTGEGGDTALNVSHINFVVPNKSAAIKKVKK